MGVPAATFSFPTFFGPDSWIGSLLSRGVVGPPASALATVTLVLGLAMGTLYGLLPRSAGRSSAVGRRRTGRRP